MNLDDLAREWGLIPDKRLGNDELAVEWNRSAVITAIHGLHADGDRTATLHRFLNTPHAHESDYQ